MEDVLKLMGNKGDISKKKKRGILKLNLKGFKSYFRVNKHSNKRLFLIFAFILITIIISIFIFIIFIKLKNEDITVKHKSLQNFLNLTSSSINNQSVAINKNEIQNNYSKNDNNNSDNNEYNNTYINNEIKTEKENYENNTFNSYNYEDSNKNEDKYCDELDPINVFNQRLKYPSTTICKNEKSSHICYKDSNSLFVAKNGVICKMENIVLDPSKWKSGGYIYKGPVDHSTRGCPLLSEGFFNMKCDNPVEYGGYDFIYDYYFNGWNYKYEDSEEKLEELAPGKIIFFLSRNQDSPNLYHGGSEFVNAVSMVYLFNLDPQNIQVVFLESIELNDDPFYDLYKNLISRGGEPIYIKNLKKKYLISSAIHVPINWDSPCFIHSNIPSCKFPTKTYRFYNDLIDKYMNISKYIDSFISDNETFYYPKSIIDNYKSGVKFTKIVTFQWRRVWPKGRKGQQRILGNGPELAEKLSSLLPKNILLRLIDTAALPISQQISIVRETDYYVGIHGAGLCLSIFSPNHCIFHEVLPTFNMNGLLLMAALSGHKTYSDIIFSKSRNIDGNELIFFDEDNFANKVIEHMKENNLI